MQMILQVIGKALVLDEIINYIQSLQRQVEVGSSSSIIVVLFTLSFHFICLNLTLFFITSAAVFVDEA